MARFEEQAHPYDHAAAQALEQRQKRIKEAIKANGGKPLPRKSGHVKKNPPLPPPAPGAGAAAGGRNPQRRRPRPQRP